MKLIKLPQVDIPGLGFGTWPLKGIPCRESVTDALSIGYRHIDTAQMYENEEEVGQGIKNAGIPRDQIFLTTKIWWTNLSHQGVIETTNQSLRKLDTDYIDLLLIHWPNKEIALAETLDAMQEMQMQSKIKHIGISNFTPALLKQALNLSPIICNQVEYHPFLSQQKLLTICEEQNLLLTAYSPIAHGKVKEDATLQEIGQKHGKTPVQVTLRWLMQQKNVAAIPKASSHEHRLSNLEIVDFELSSEEMNKIFSLANGSRLINPSWSHDWD